MVDRGAPVAPTPPTLDEMYELVARANRVVAAHTQIADYMSFHVGGNIVVSIERPAYSGCYDDHHNLGINLNDPGGVETIYEERARSGKTTSKWGNVGLIKYALHVLRTYQVLDDLAAT